MRRNMLKMLDHLLGPASRAADGCDWWRAAPHLHICLESAVGDANVDGAAHLLIYDRHPRDGEYITEASPRTQDEALSFLGRVRLRREP